MGFLSGAAGGQNNFRATPATGNSKFTEQDLLPAIAQGQTGFQQQLGNVQNIGSAQGNLADMLLAQAQGAGPNIAEEQLKQATNRNIQQGAGLIASQRGMNPALAARLIANQTANANQQEAGQAGLMRAQQQLASQGLLNNVYGNQAQTALGGGQLANQNLGINQNALSSQNSNIVQARGAADALNANIESENAKARQSATGGFLNGLGGVLSSPLTGGIFNSIGGLFKGNSDALNAGRNMISDTSPTATSNSTNLSGLMAYNGGEIDYVEGGHVPGEAPVQGDSPENDIVHARLSPGEVVLPRSVTQSEDAPDRAKEFMNAIMKERSSEPKGYSKILEMKRRMKEAHDHLDDLHKMIKNRDDN